MKSNQSRFFEAVIAFATETLHQLGEKLSKEYILSSSNGTLQDIAAATELLEDAKSRNESIITPFTVQCLLIAELKKNELDTRFISYLLTLVK